MTGSAEQPVAGRFDPPKLVTEVNQCFTGFHFTIQAVPPTKNWAELVKVWLNDKAAAEKNGQPFDDPPPSHGALGSARFERCVGEPRDSGFVLKLSMKSQSGRLFVIFIEKDDMVPEIREEIRRVGHHGPYRNQFSDRAIREDERWEHIRELARKALADPHDLGVLTRDLTDAHYNTPLIEPPR
jgi:hypothetical protein